MNTRLLLLIGCLFALPARSKEPIDADHRVDVAVGRVIRLYERYMAGEHGGSGGLLVSQEIEAQFAKLAKAPTNARVEFLWAVLMHVQLQNTFQEDLYELVVKDEPCARRILERLRKVGKEEAASSRGKLAEQHAGVVSRILQIQGGEPRNEKRR